MYDHSYTSDAVQAATMEMLLATHPGLLSRNELHREIDARTGVDDALNYFLRLGLVHRIENAAGEEFFWATRTTMATEEAATAKISCESKPR